MSMINEIGYRLYSSSSNITIEGFSFLAINNRGGTSIELRRNDPEQVYYIDTGQAFSFPFLGSKFDMVQIVTNGNNYSIITDGTIT